MNEEQKQVAAPTTTNWRWWAFVAMIGIALAFQGWLRTSRWDGVLLTTAGESLVYRPSAWWLAIFAVPAALMILMGVAIVTVRHPLARLIGGFVLLVSLASLVAIPPTILTGRLVVTPDGFTHTAGFWWSPVSHTVRFNSLESLRIVPDPSGEFRPSFVLECRRRDGQTVKIPSSDLLKAGLRAITFRALRRGVVLEDMGIDDMSEPPRRGRPARVKI